MAFQSRLAASRLRRSFDSHRTRCLSPFFLPLHTIPNRPFWSSKRTTLGYQRPSRTTRAAKANGRRNCGPRCLPASELPTRQEAWSTSSPLPLGASHQSRIEHSIRHLASSTVCCSQLQRYGSQRTCSSPTPPGERRAWRFCRSRWRCACALASLLGSIRTIISTGTRLWDSMERYTRQRLCGGAWRRSSTLCAKASRPR